MITVPRHKPTGPGRWQLRRKPSIYGTWRLVTPKGYRLWFDTFHGARGYMVERQRVTRLIEEIKGGTR